MDDSERASTLLLFPAAVFVVFVLGAIAADMASVFLGERELANATAAAEIDSGGHRERLPATPDLGKRYSAREGRWSP